MSASAKTEFRVFYSWQSDLPDAINSQLIRSALSDAATALNESHDLNFRVWIDEATRDVSGSPNIPASIFDKICRADAFVCDLTKIVQAEMDGELRKFCNPNVAIELGFAIRELGWERIITVFNTAYGKLPDDLPFDAKTHRATPYTCRAEFNGKKPSSTCEEMIKNAKGFLRTQFRDALTLIHRNNPHRGSVPTKKKTASELRRERDVQQLAEVLYWINPQIMDQLLNVLGYGRLTLIAWDFVERIQHVVSSAKFHLHDKELERRIEALVEAWTNCYRYATEMETNQHRQELYFHLPMDMFQSKEQEKHFNYTTEQRVPLRKSLRELLDYVRENYLEFDVSSIGREAVAEHQKQRSDIE